MSKKYEVISCIYGKITKVKQFDNEDIAIEYLITMQDKYLNNKKISTIITSDIVKIVNDNIGTITMRRSYIEVR